MKLLYLISLILLMTGISLFFLIWYLESKKRIHLIPRKKEKYAILIPAKNESHVIEGLLKSIKIQVADMSCCYVIVENSKDKTCNITKKYGGNIIVRKDLEGKRRKGYALDEAIKAILKKEKYDLYFIFDADNILDKDYINKMLETYKKGYDIGTGYRNIKNSTNSIAVCSGLTFSMVNCLINKNRQKNNNAITICGTGYYISKNLINKWKGFPFNSLTEDYELSLYASANNISTYYNDEAVFYDEQPTNMKVSIKQRTRWVKGFFEARYIRLKDVKDDYSKLIGIIPYLMLISGFLIFLLANLFDSIVYLTSSNFMYLYTIFSFLSSLLIVYIFLIIFTIILFKKEKREFNVDKKKKIKAILFNPIFLSSYIICLINALKTKDLEWETIEHKEKKIERV